MARAAMKKVYANFSGGYVTEGNVLSFPENAASDMVNIDLKESGSIGVRYGMGFDSNTSIPMPASRATVSPAVNTFKWSSVGGDASKDVAVVQVGDRLDFFLLREDGITDTARLSYITLPKAEGSSVATSDLVYSNNIRVASGAGRLFIVGKYIDPAYLTMSSSTNAVTRTKIDMKLRDFSIWKEGEYSGSTSLAGERRQSTLSGYHQYNLYNQGWPDKRDVAPFTGVGDAISTVSKSDQVDAGTIHAAPIHYTMQSVGFFPDTSDNMHAFQAGGGSAASEQTAFNPWKMLTDYTGNTKAARGHSILDYFSRRREGQGTNVLDWEVETVSTGFRPESVAFYAGRVWYAGTQGASFSSEVAFSQILDSDLKKAGNCYQEADPTAQDVNELIATDGGILSIDEMGQVFKMVQFGSALLLITSNGVWSISGEGEIASFSATSFSITKVSDKAALSNNSITVAKDSVYYLGTTALYQIGRSEIGTLGVTDISSAKIKTFYQSLTTSQKTFVFTAYDEGRDTISWHYPSTVDVNVTPIPLVDRVLYLDLSLQAFGKYSLALDSSVNIRSSLGVDLSTVVTIEDAVVSGLDAVVSGLDAVVSTTTYEIPDRSSVKFLAIEEVSAGNYEYRFSDYRDRSFKDFGNSYTGYIDTGFDSLEDIMQKSKKAPIAVFHLERTEDGFDNHPTEVGELVLTNQSSCLVSYKWDWASSPYGNQFQAYRLLKNYTPSGVGDGFDYDRDVVTSKNRLRGRGTAIGFRLSSEEGKDMRVLGYGVLFTMRDTI